VSSNSNTTGATRGAEPVSPRF